MGKVAKKKKINVRKKVTVKKLREKKVTGKKLREKILIGKSMGFFFP